MMCGCRHMLTHDYVVLAFMCKHVTMIHDYAPHNHCHMFTHDYVVVAPTWCQHHKVLAPHNHTTKVTTHTTKVTPTNKHHMVLAPQMWWMMSCGGSTTDVVLGP